MIDNEDSRSLANNIREKIEQSIGHHYRMVQKVMAESI